jgi:hypothetical protein
MPATGKKKLIVISFSDQQTLAASRIASAGLDIFRRPATIQAGCNAHGTSSFFDDGTTVHRGKANVRASKN